MLVKLSNEKPEARAARIQSLDSTSEWISSFMDKQPYNDTAPKASDFVELDRNFKSNITHPGLIHYAHYCWAKEYGLSLRPDMIYNAIISEIAFDILSNPDDYKHLFTGTTNQKINILTVGKLFDYDQMISLIKSKILEPDFADAICDLVFESDVPNARRARLMAFANMGTPFFNLFGTMCGIPHVEIVGSYDDWVKLYDAIRVLQRFGPSESARDYRRKHYANHMEKSLNIVANIIYYCFDIRLDPMTQMYNTKEEFFSDIFHYGSNVVCGSGHDTMVVSGWLRFFYGDSDEGVDLDHYHCHTNYVCMHDLDTNKRYCQVVSLAFSELDSENNILRPGYGIVTYEVLNRKIYNKLAMISKDTGLFSRGPSYNMTKDELREVMEKGTLNTWKKECTWCKNTFSIQHEYYSHDGKDICGSCTHTCEMVDLPDDPSPECFLCGDILTSQKCPGKRIFEFNWDDDSNDDSNADPKYMCVKCFGTWGQYRQSYDRYHKEKCDWCSVEIKTGVPFTCHEGLNVCKQCGDTAKSSLENRGSIIFPCLGPTARTSDKRSWYVPEGKTSHQCTICEECFEDKLRSKVDASTFTRYDGLYSCCCDYEITYPATDNV